jgi:RNA polymerase sigma-70 factor (ECF subfamily)
MVLRRARAILGEEQAAKDILQEVFIRVLHGAAAFRGESSPATWLYRMTTNLCLNQLRDRARRSEILAARWVKDATFEDAPESRMTVSRVLSGLPEELREIAIYYFVDQMNQEEIAEILQVSRRTVGYRLEQFRELAQAATEEPWAKTAS